LVWVFVDVNDSVRLRRRFRKLVILVDAHACMIACAPASCKRMSHIGPRDALAGTCYGSNDARLFL
jgi:hypothetical protein